MAIYNPLTRKSRKQFRFGPPPPPPWAEYEQTIEQHYRVAGTGQYELYLGQDANPDFTAAPDATSATLPFNHALAPPGAGEREYRACVRWKNKFGVVSLNQYTRRFVINAAGVLVSKPSTPVDVSVRDGFSLTVIVVAVYHFRDDDVDDRADTWDVYYTDTGANPNPAVDTPETKAMVFARDTEQLKMTLGPFAAEADFRCIVRARRSSSGADDGNSDVYQHDVTAMPGTPDHGITFGGEYKEYR